MTDSRVPRLSAASYFALVATLTALALGANASFRADLMDIGRAALGLPDPHPVASGSFYAVRIAPLLEEHCISCHGPGRQKGKLRLDRLPAIVRGGRSGSVLHIEGAKQSELVRRISLPASDENAMPPNGEALSRDEIKVIEMWVAAGASGMRPVSAFKGAPKPAMTIKFAQIDVAAVEKLRAPLAGSVSQLQQRFPGVIAYESRGSADLYVNASLNGASFGPADLEALAPLSERIVWADFSNTKVDDGSVTALAAMRRLRVLRLTNTKATDAMLEQLAVLKELRSLSVVGAPVTEKSVTALRSRGIKVYDG